MFQAIKKIYLGLKFRSSKDYWDERYLKGGDSGKGSYGRLAEFKAEVLNDFVKRQDIKSVVEFGCGDGNQLTLAAYPSYIGLDVSRTAIKLCIQMFESDRSKSFFLYDRECFQDKTKVIYADLAMSLDVIYHLVEDDVFESYMRDLFSSAGKWVVIYSSNAQDSYYGHHVRQRAFTDWVEKNMTNWTLESKIPNKYPFVKGDPETSFADFYFYKREI